MTNVRAEKYRDLYCVLCTVHCGTMVLCYCGTVVLCYCGTVVLWYCVHWMSSRDQNKKGEQRWTKKRDRQEELLAIRRLVKLADTRAAESVLVFFAVLVFCIL